MEQADTIQFTIAELEFEQNTRNCLKLAVHKAIDQLNKELGSSFKLTCRPDFQFIGLPHLFTLIHSLYRIDRGLIQDLAGKEERFTYDSPKFVEAIIRIVRGIHYPHTQFPIFRIDEDVEVNETAIGLLLDHAREVMQSPDLCFFSGGYGRYGEPLDPVNDYAVRLHWLVDPHSHTLSNQSSCFLRDLGEFGATQVSTDKPVSNFLRDWFKELKREPSANRASQQVISGAGLFMSFLAIHTLPPFMNFRTLVTWIDDHLKRQLHEALGHLSHPPETIEHVENALFRQDRHPGGITEGWIDWAKDVYFERLLSGCIMHALITTPAGEKGELAIAVEAVVLRGYRVTFDEEDLRGRLDTVATQTALAVLNLWAHADYGNSMLRTWAEGMLKRISSWLFHVDDFRESTKTEPTRLAIRLRDAQDPLSRYLLEQFASEAQEELKAYDGSAPLSQPMKNIVVDKLNRVLESNDLFERCVEYVPLTERIQRLILKQTKDEEWIPINRLLLEHACETEVPKSLIRNIVNDALAYVNLVRRWPQYVGAIQMLKQVHAYWLFRRVDENLPTEPTQ